MKHVTARPAEYEVCGFQAGEVNPTVGQCYPQSVSEEESRES